MSFDPSNPVVDLPAEKTLPGEVRAMLKSVNPMVDAYYAGNGTWWILEYQPNTARQLSAVARLERIKNNPKARPKDIASAQLQYQGWALLFPFHSELGDYPNSWCQGQIRRIMAITDAEMDAVGHQLERDASGETKLEARDAALRDMAQTEGKTFYNIEIKNRVSVIKGEPTPTTAANAAGPS